MKSLHSRLYYNMYIVQCGKLKTVYTDCEFTNMFQNNNGNLIVVYKFITMISNYIQNLLVASPLFRISIITYCTIIVQDVRLILQI